MDIAVERVFADPQEENDRWKNPLSENSRCRRNHPKKVRSTLLVEFLKRRRLIDDQFILKILYNSMSMTSKRLALGRD